MDNIEPSRIEISLAPNGEIRIWLRRASASSAGNKLDSDVVLFSLKASDLLSAAPNTAVSILGARVLAAMAHLGEQSLGHMGYGVLNEQANALDEKQLLERVASNDAEALYELALERIFRGTELRDVDSLNLAEDYLKRASAKGCERATDFLERVWPEEKKARLKMISGGNADSAGP